MKFKLLIVCLVVHAFVSAQSVLFQKGDRVCFVGNSITHNGEYYHNVLLYYATRFPDKPISFFNCGISGDVCSGVLKRIDKDVLIHQPTHVVIMIGMNDVNRGLYGVKPTNNADTLAKREEAIATYKVRLDSIVNIFLSKGIKVILQKPTIYDQTAAIIKNNNLGVNDALKRCADYIQTLADKYKLPVVDYWSILNNINTALQKKDSAATIIGADRVHPGSAGHLIMAYQFLKSNKAPSYVAEIAVKKNIKTSNQQSKNCIISGYVREDDSIVFKVQESALPFPTNKSQIQALELVPFINDLSVEKLRVQKANKNNQLFIDTALIGTFTKKELAKGINLSLYTNTPQYKQALQVGAVLDKMWKAVADLRTIAFVELGFLTGYSGDQNDLNLKKQYLDNLFNTKLFANTYYKKQFDRYIMVKPNQTQLELDVEKFRLEAYKMAQPVAHQFILKNAN